MQLLRAVTLAALAASVAANTKQYTYTQTVGPQRPADSAPADAFTSALVMTADGKEVIIGAHGADQNGIGDQGFVGVYKYDAKARTLTETQRLRPPVPNTVVGDQYGFALALSADEKWLAVSDPFPPNPATNVIIYSRRKKGQAWAATHKVVNPNPTPTVGLNDFYSWSLSISKDGKVLVVSALEFFAAGDAQRRGAIYIYKRGKDNQYRFTQGPITPATVSTNFGFATSMTNDAKWIVVGATNEQAGRGAVYLYKLNKQSGLYALVGQPIVPYTTFGNFGGAVAFSPNEKYLAVGAPALNGGKGALTIFKYQSASGTYVVSQLNIVPAGTATTQPANFADALFWSADGKYLGVGQPAETINNVLNNDGKAWIATAKNGVWQLGTKSINPTPAGAGTGFGNNLAVSRGAKVLAIGAHNAATVFTGTIYMFNRASVIKT